MHIEKENKMTRFIINKLRENLENRIKGTVKASVVNGDLIVDIFAHGLAFRFYRKDIEYYVKQGVTIKTITNDILKEFLFCIKRNFFK